MAYIGQDLSQGKATRVTYNASGGETSITQSYTPGHSLSKHRRPVGYDVQR